MIRRFFKTLYRFIIRLYHYLPVLWKDNDFDYGSVLNMMSFKFKRLEEHIRDHACFEGYEEVADELKNIQKYINEYQDSYPSLEANHHWDSIWRYINRHGQKWWC